MTDDWGREAVEDSATAGGWESTATFDDFDAGDVDSSNIGSGAIKVDRPGSYHFEITSAKARPKPYHEDDMSKSRKPDISLAMKVLLSVKDQSPEGAVHYHQLIMGKNGGGPPEKADKESTLNFLVGIGILQINSAGLVIDPETGTTKLNSGTLEQRLQGRQFIGHIELSKGGPKKDKITGIPEVDADGRPVYWPDKLGFNYGRGAFRLDDPKVKHVPRKATPKDGQPASETAKPAAAPATATAADLDI